jgi:hypothetical protein
MTLVTLGAEVVAISTVQLADAMKIRTGLVKPRLPHFMGVRQIVDTPFSHHTERTGIVE